MVYVSSRLSVYVLFRVWFCVHVLMLIFDTRKEDGHIDDHFILLSMVFQNMDIDIVTADKFGDHVDSLDTSTRRDFQRWMRAHQIVLHTFTENGLPKFRRREHFDTDVQSNKTSWHIPGPNKQWLCCNRR